MKHLIFRLVDFLDCPTMLGASCRRTRWHHGIRLIPASWAERACSWVDD